MALHPSLEFFEVSSSNLWLLAYDGDRLFIVFRTHERLDPVAVYSYEVVPSLVVRLLLADSRGSFFAKNIRGLPFTKTMTLFEELTVVE